MWIERGDTDSGRAVAQRGVEVLRKPDLCEDGFGRDLGKDVAERNVEGNVDDGYRLSGMRREAVVMRGLNSPAQLGITGKVKHHRVVWRTTTMSEDLGVPGKTVPGRMEGGLAERCGRDCVYVPAEREIDRGVERVEGGGACARVDLTGRNFQAVVADNAKARHDGGRRCRFVDAVDFDDVNFGATEGGSATEYLRMAQNDWSCMFVERCVRPGAGDDFRPDAGNIPHRDGNSRYGHTGILSAREDVK